MHRRIEHGFANGTSMTEDYSYTYDGWGRLLSTGHTLGSGSEVTLASNTYDFVGRLSRTDRGSSSSAATTYSYNVRSWLTGQTGPYSESLAYNTIDDAGNNTTQWSGNISAQQWSVTGDIIAHRYAFEYDGVSRLSSASYSGLSGADYSCSYTYDRNSNLKTMVRKGLLNSGLYGIIDNKAYVYDGNQLISDGSSYSVQSEYDDNGRLTADCFESINEITYNILGLPETMDFTIQQSSPRSLRNWYSADGTKLRTEWRTANDTIPKDYVGNLVFVNDTLRTILVDGGYIDVSYPSSSPQYSYRWFLTDHQGSNRATINASGSIVQANHYYPYGPEMKLAIMFDGGPADNVVEQTGYLYKFSGKEQIPQSSLGWYDFGARWYDPIHARWTTPDPMAEKYYSISPYVYCAGNPVNIVDPDGKDWVTKKGSYDFEWMDEVTNSQLVPEGYEYVGSQNNDILSYMGLPNEMITEESTMIGHIPLSQNGSIAGFIAPTVTTHLSITTITDTAYNNASDKNKQGKVFKGIQVKSVLISPNMKDIEVISRMYISTDSGTFESKYSLVTEPSIIPEGYSASESVVKINKADLGHNNEIKKITSKGSMVYSTSAGRYVPMLFLVFPINNSFNHVWKK